METNGYKEDERREEIMATEERMNKALSNPTSTYSEMSEAIDNFFNSW